MFRASDIFGRRSGAGAPRAQAKAQATQKRLLGGGGPKSSAWDSATGQFVEEELPSDIQEMMGMRKRVKTESGEPAQPARALGPKSVGLSAKVKLETPGATSSAPASVGSIDTDAVSVEYQGFGKVELNDRYYEKADIRLHGKSTFWTEDGSFFIYWQGEVQRWAICDGTSLSACRAGQYPGWAYKGDHKHLSLANGWLEAYGGEWREPEIEVAFRCSSHHGPQWNDNSMNSAVTSVEFAGFAMKELNTRYMLRAHEVLQGRPTYWDIDGVYFVYWQKPLARWAICDLKCIEAVRLGQTPGWAYRSDSAHFANASGWMETRADQWANASIETCVVGACTKGLKVEFNGFYKNELNIQYTEKSSEEIQGKPSYWDPTDSYFIYWQSSMNRWAICDSVSASSARAGLSPGWAYRTDSKHFTQSSGWMENWGREWRSASVTCTLLEGIVRAEQAGMVKAELGEGELSVDTCRILVQRLYADKNPAKLSEVDSLLDKWEGRETELFRSICTKYGVNADEYAAEVAPQDPSQEEAEDDWILEDAEVPELDPMQYAVHIQAVYERYNAKKLADLGKLLAKYRNRERELFLEVCKKYGVHPAKFYFKRLKEEEQQEEQAEAPRRMVKRE